MEKDCNYNSHEIMHKEYDSFLLFPTGSSLSFDPEKMINDSGSVSMESIMDTITRVYFGVTVMSLAAQITFPFYNHLKTNEENVNKSLKKFTTTYLSDICFNESAGGDPEYGTCPKPSKSLT